MQIRINIIMNHTIVSILIMAYKSTDQDWCLAYIIQSLFHNIDETRSRYLLDVTKPGHQIKLITQ